MLSGDAVDLANGTIDNGGGLRYRNNSLGYSVAFKCNQISNILPHFNNTLKNFITNITQ